MPTKNISMGRQIRWKGIEYACNSERTVSMFLVKAETQKKCACKWRTTTGRQQLSRDAKEAHFQQGALMTATTFMVREARSKLRGGSYSVATFERCIVQRSM